MWVAVMGWGIALVEYWLAVPANRIGYGTYSAAELKTIQEVISLTHGVRRLCRCCSARS